MGKGEHLGEFEQVVLLALAKVGEEAHGRAIYEEIVATTGREVSVAAVHVTLNRLQQKGYVGSELGKPTRERGGRARKLFRLESEGAAALREARQMFERLWKGARMHPELRKG